MDRNKKFYVVEKSAQGAGKCCFESDLPVLFIKAMDKSTVLWSLKDKKCAEAAFCTVDAGGHSCLHIVEMKSGLTLSKFNHVIEQFKGMLLAALATLSVTRNVEPTSVIVYLAYTDDKISYPPEEYGILRKTLVGGEEIAGKREWRRKEVMLHHSIKAKLITGQRVNGDVDFGKIA
ncbi:hypothetical protein [Rhodobacter sp. 24-YEA-8]|uniref:hypothetical protein n=1 Tax=Rhodobacter sp. 24-YEA-8 TaxID=1884310 RepID=UPI00115FB242|nr:hypothetical protein [Rhodobacter sp. 24-YEA-8]